jgi:hypothetical protein
MAVIIMTNIELQNVTYRNYKTAKSNIDNSALITISAMLYLL